MNAWTTQIRVCEALSVKTLFSQQSHNTIILIYLWIKRLVCAIDTLAEASICGPTFSYVTKNHCIILLFCQLQWGGQGGLATAFDLAAFRLSMIAPVKKSVNHSRTVASMRETGWEQQQEVRLRSDSTVWRSEFTFGSVGHCFLCCNRFFPQ